jgi:electron transfer flavoprotein beta subunit
MINIVVCIKQVIDPEVPPAYFEIDPEAKRAIPPKGSPPILNPFDENALEAALMIKNSIGAEVTAISMGQRLAKPVLRTTLAVGADKLILLEDDAFDSFDSYKTAYVIASAIRKKYGKCDLVLCGRQAADTNDGQVGLGIAEILGIPSITVARKIEVDGREVIVERITSDGYEVIKASMPVLVTVSSEIGELRFPSLVAIRAAQKKEITVWKTEDLELDPVQSERTDLVKLFMPPVGRKITCEMIEDVDAEEAGKNLALRLREAGVL